MKHAPPPLTEHRVSRFITWGRLLLVWLGGFLFSGDKPIHRRDLRARLFWTDLDNVAGYISCLVLLRAFLRMEDCDSGSAAPRRRIDFSAHGFARRTRIRSLRRAARGAWLRKRLRHRDLRTRFALIVNALNNLDALAVRAERRLRHRLTRLFALRIVHNQCDAVRSLALSDVQVADSS